MLVLVSDEGVLYHYINSKWMDFALLINSKRRVSAHESSYTIDLDENNLNTFSTYTTMYKDIKSVKDIHNKVKYLIYSYSPPSVESVIPVIKKVGIGIGILTAAAVAVHFLKK